MSPKASPFFVCPPPNNIGRFARILLLPGREVVYGNVIDLVAGTGEPKRIRIQHGLPARKGDVVMPYEYEFEWWANEEED